MFKTNRRNQTPRNLVAKLMGWNADANALEQRIVPAYVSGDFGWAEDTSGGRGTNGFDTAVDKNGNIYKTGTFSRTVDFDPGDGFANLTATPNGTAYIQKVDSNGQFLWAKAFDSINFRSEARSISIDPTGNLIVTGSFAGTVDFDPSSNFVNLTSNGNLDIFLSKLSSDGVLLWADSFGGIGNDKGDCVTVDKNGDIILGGKFNNTVDFDSNNSTNSLTANDGIEDIFIAKYNSNGSYIWADSIAGTGGNKSIRSLRTDSLNNVILGGAFIGAIDIDPSQGSFVFVNTSPNYADNGYLVKIDSYGRMLWGQHLACPRDSAVSAIAIDDTDNIYVGGYYYISMDVDPSQNVFTLTTPTAFPGYAYLEKLSANSTLIWAKTWGESDRRLYGCSVDTIVIDSNKRITVTGRMDLDKTNLDPSGLTPAFNNTLDPSNYISLFDPNGDFYYSKILGTNIYTTLRTEGGDLVFRAGNPGGSDFDPELPVKGFPLTGDTVVKWIRRFTKTSLSVSNSLFGANTTLTAVVQNENNTTTAGTVTFTDLFNGVTTTIGNANVVNGVATLNLASLTTGVHSFTASYSGDGTNFSSNSYPLVSQVDAVAGSWGWAQAQVNRTGNEESYPSTKVATDSMGNIYYAGSFTGTIDFDAGTATQSFTSVSSRDTYLEKVSPSGRLLWFKQWSNSSIGLTKILIDSTNRINVTGSFSGTIDSDPTTGIKNLVSNGGTDGFLVRMSTDGNFIDSLSMGGTTGDSINSIAYDSLQNMYFGGIISGTVDFDLSSGVSNKTSAGGYDGFLAKYNAAGVYQWVNSFSSSSDDIIYDVCSDNQDNMYVLGDTGSVVDLDNSSAIANTIGAGIIAKYNSVGQLLNQGPVTPTSSNFTTCQIVFKNNAIFISGDVSGHTFVASLNTDLSKNWWNQFDGNNSLLAGIDVDANSNVFMSGFYSGIIDVNPSTSVTNLTSNGGYDIFVVKWDKNGGYISGVTLGSSGYDVSGYEGTRNQSIAVSNNGSVIACGAFSGTVDFDPTSATQNLSSYPSDLTKRSRYVLNLSNYAVVTTATSLTTTPHIQRLRPIHHPQHGLKRHERCNSLRLNRFIL